VCGTQGALLDKLDCVLFDGDEILEQPVVLENTTQKLTQRSLTFLDQQEDKPFLLVHSFIHMHTALFAAPEWQNSSPRGAYGDAMNEMDWSVGEIMKKIELMRQTQDIVVFGVSDNGPWLEEKLDGGSSGMLRGTDLFTSSLCSSSFFSLGGKGQIWEGGVRVPAFINWPQQLGQSSLTHKELTSSMDLFPTIADLLNISLPSNRVIDGRSLAPLLRNQTYQPHSFLPYYCGTKLSAARQGPYKVGSSSLLLDV
jgi:arylsulfatase A-like enzyme